jgi:predicted O-methyltransferase YrrM
MQFNTYVEYRNGELNKKDYQRWLRDMNPQLKALGLNGAQLRRLPFHVAREADNAQTMLREFGFPADVYSRPDYQDFHNKVCGSYEYGGYQTSIYPDEEELAYALTHAIKPRSSFYAGSYFGYWAIYMMPAITEVRGSITLCDINPKVSALCAANMVRFRYADSAVFAAEDAEMLLLSSSEPIDFVVLDATAPFDNPDPERRGKGIYGVLAKTALPRLRKGGFVLVHNHELDEPGLQPMFELLNRECSKGLHLDSYNGLGVYRK